MLFRIALATAPALVAANHLVGDVQNALFACQEARCPGSKAFFDTLGEFDDFVPTSWLTDPDYALDFLKAKVGHTDFLECLCEKCPGNTEPIWQPVAREGCGKFGLTLPCQAEFDACLAVHSLEVCSPDTGIWGYFKAYDLSSSEVCASLPAEVKALAECTATSRIAAAAEFGMNVEGIPCVDGDCKGVPAAKCARKCHYEGTQQECDPHSRRLLFGGHFDCICE